MASTGNVVRYSALITGVFYGIIHKRTLQTQKKQKETLQAQHHQDDLVAKAKEAWKQKQLAKVDGAVIMDPDNPSFDGQRFLAEIESGKYD